VKDLSKVHTWRLEWCSNLDSNSVHNTNAMICDRIKHQKPSLCNHGIVEVSVRFDIVAINIDFILCMCVYETPFKASFEDILDISGQSMGVEVWPCPSPSSLSIDFSPLQQRNKGEILGSIKLAPPVECLDCCGLL